MEKRKRTAGGGKSGNGRELEKNVGKSKEKTWSRGSREKGKRGKYEIMSRSMKGRERIHGEGKIRKIKERRERKK